MADVITLSDENFETEVTGSQLPVVIDFWAPWCGPCRVIAPIIEELAAEHGDKVKVCKVNVDDCQGTAGKYEVMSIPTILFFRNGKEFSRRIGSNTTKFMLLEELGITG